MQRVIKGLPAVLRSASQIAVKLLGAVVLFRLSFLNSGALNNLPGRVGCKVQAGSVIHCVLCRWDTKDAGCA